MIMKGQRSLRNLFGDSKEDADHDTDTVVKQAGVAGFVDVALDDGAIGSCFSSGFDSVFLGILDQHFLDGLPSCRRQSFHVGLKFPVFDRFSIGHTREAPEHGGVFESKRELTIIEVMHLLEKSHADHLFARHTIASNVRSMRADKIFSSELSEVWKAVENIRDHLKTAGMLVLARIRSQGELFGFDLTHLLNLQFCGNEDHRALELRAALTVRCVRCLRKVFAPSPSAC